MAATLRIGERHFHELEESTLAHDAYCMQQLRLAGLDRVALRPGESAELFAERLLFDIMSSGRLFDLLGGLLMPAGMSAVEWSPDVAAETARFIGGLTDPQEKEKTQRLILSILIPFFLGALDFSADSKGSSAGDEVTDAPDAKGIPTSTGHGVSSSGVSPVTTPSAPPG